MLLKMLQVILFAAVHWGHHLASRNKTSMQKGSIHMKTALTIAGSDSSGGAGIQADIKTMTANGVFAMSAVTALTAQNTTGVKDIMEVSPAFLRSSWTVFLLISGRTR